MSASVDVLVYGPTGFTGRLVLAELVRRRISFAIAGRPGPGLVELGRTYGVTAAAAPLDDAAAVDGAFRLARVVLACAGPFEETGARLIDVALRTRTHLLDLSGEPQHLRRALARDAEIAEHGIAVVHSVGFDVIPGELLAWMTQSPLREEVALELATAHTKGLPSHGTLQSFLRMSLERPGQGLGVEGGVVVDEALGAHRRVVPFPEPIGARAAISVPSAEVVLLPRSVPLSTLRHYMGTLAPAALAVAERGLANFTTELLERALAQQADTRQRGPDATERAQSRFALWCQARTVRGETRSMTLVGGDAYGLTAVLAVSCAHMATEERFTARGALTPLQAFDPQRLLGTLAESGVAWRRSSAE